MMTIVGWHEWSSRIENLRASMSGNQLLDEYMFDRYGLELSLGRIIQYHRTTNRYPWPPRTALEYRLYSFLATVVHVHTSLSPAGRARLAGAIRSALEKEFGLGPLAFEMKVVAHFMSRGFQIDFHDLESGGGYDFLAISGSAEIEVECKHLSCDIGRRIHRRKFYDLGGILLPAISQAVDRGSGGRLVCVTLPGRLSGTIERQQALKERIGSVLSGEISEVNDSVCSVSSQSFSLSGSPFSGDHECTLTNEDIRKYLMTAFDIHNTNVLSYWCPGRAAVVVVFKSERPDRVLNKILKRLKDGIGRQFSGERPALLCVHLADLTQEQLLDLANAQRAGTRTGIQYIMEEILQARPHVHSISIMTDGQVSIEKSRFGRYAQISVQEVGPSWILKNPNHPLAGNPTIDRVFSRNCGAQSTIG